MFTSAYAPHLLIKRNDRLETKNLSTIIYWFDLGSISHVLCSWNTRVCCTFPPGSHQM